MKKRFILLATVLVFALSACTLTTKSSTTLNTTTTTNKVTTTTTSKQTTTKEKVEYPDLQGKTFTIMCDNKASCDPRSDSYQRLFKKEKIANIAPANNGALSAKNPMR